MILGSRQQPNPMHPSCEYHAIAIQICIHVEQVGDFVVSKSNLACVDTRKLAESVVVANLVKLFLQLNK